MTRKTLTIAIIGAGLGGFCLAQGLKKAGINASVYERDPQFDKRGQGYRIRIDPAGQASLKTCLPTELFDLFLDTCATNQSVGQLVNPQLESITGRPSTNWQLSVRSGEIGDLSVHRKTLREILMQGLEEQVHFGKTFDYYQDETGQLYFKGGINTSADIVIGADGVYSSVREQFWPELRPKDSNAVCVYAALPWSHVLSAQLNKGTTVVFENDFTCIIDMMRFNPATWQMLTPVDDYIYWAIVAPRDYFGLDNDDNITTKLQITEYIEKLTAHWHLELRQLFAHTPPESIYLAPVKSSPLPAFTPIKNVILIGDALHTMSPAGGIGANTALEDAKLLTQALTKAMETQSFQSLKDYYLQMHSRTAQALLISEEGTVRLLSEG